MKSVCQPERLVVCACVLAVVFVASGCSRRDALLNEPPASPVGQAFDPSTQVCTDAAGPTIAFKVDMLARDFVRPNVSIASATAAHPSTGSTTP
jgi:hypothetical protein